MRDFYDEGGCQWDAAIGEESYGAMVLRFSQRDSREVQKSPFDAATKIAAEQELDALAVDQLRGRLRNAEPWH